MSNLDNEKQYSNLTDMLQFSFDQMLKDIYVSIPGIIETYNKSTKRCRVIPAINIALTDGSFLDPAPIENVPVIWPGGGGFTILSPLPAGTPVEIKFSQRGISKFKEVFSQVDPDLRMFDKTDAHVVPGYGALSISPATGSGISMQAEDGGNYIYVESGTIKIHASSEVIIEAPINTINGPTTIDGTLEVTGTITAPEIDGGGVSYTTHIHSQGNDGNGDAEVDTGVPHS